MLKYGNFLAEPLWLHDIDIMDNLVVFIHRKLRKYLKVKAKQFNIAFFKSL